jgi:hypothetical protein
MSRLNPTAALLGLLTLLATPARADIFWTGATSNDIFDETNWDLTQSTVTVIDPDVTIDDDVYIVNATAIVEIPNNGGGQSRLEVGDGFTLTIDNSTVMVLGNDGIGGAPGTAAGPIVQLLNGASLTVFFITNSTDLQVGTGCMAAFLGAATPINGSTVDLTSNTWLHFVNETVADYISEHLKKTTVDGAPAVVDVNVGVMTDGSVGSIVSAISQVGTNYCGPANANSTGSPATISSWGLPEVVANKLTLIATGLPTGELGYFLCSLTAGFVPGPGGSLGNLCLGGKIGRFVKQVQTSDKLGEFSIPVDLSALPVWRNQPALAGQTWNFQAWFKDGKSSNFTDGLAVTFR